MTTCAVGPCDLCTFPLRHHDYQEHTPGDTTLIYAAYNNHAACARMWLQAGVNINARNIKGDTALAHACIYGNARATRVLLRAGARVNAVNRQGQTPLLLACQAGHTHCVKLLLENRAAMNIADNEGKTALVTATDRGWDECVRILESYGAIQRLGPLAKVTCLKNAAFHGMKTFVRQLIQSGADVNGCEQDYGVNSCCTGVSVNYCEQCVERSQTPLMKACQQGHVYCIRLLLTAGADVNKADVNGFTPSMCAVSKISVKTLIRAGADVNITDNDGDTALTEAAIKGNADIVKILLKADAKINVNLQKVHHKKYSIKYQRHNYSITVRNDYKGQTNTKRGQRGKKGKRSLPKLGHTDPDYNIIKELGHNALETHILYSNSICRDTVFLLYAAGEKVRENKRDPGMQSSRYTDKGNGNARNVGSVGACALKVPDVLDDRQVGLRLDHQCREVIRTQLLTVDPHGPLFNRVQKLGLPGPVVQYLLYHTELQM